MYLDSLIFLRISAIWLITPGNCLYSVSSSSNNLLADGDKTKSNNKNKKKVVENVNEVKDLAPLLYTCLSLHIGKPEAQKAMNYFSGIEAQYLNSLSLDDIEEIASIKQEGES